MRVLFGTKRGIDPKEDVTPETGAPETRSDMPERGTNLKSSPMITFRNGKTAFRAK
jgi:hypothetical protein